LQALVEAQRDHAPEPLAMPLQQRPPLLAVSLRNTPEHPVCFT
jgi:hypothetical protein